jgi:hypothetical protein
MKRCSHCRTVQFTTAWRRDVSAMLCVECWLDWIRAMHTPIQTETRVWRSQ